MRQAGVACYTVVVGKLNEPKLANIANVGVYCLIACREVYKKKFDFLKENKF